MSRLRRETDDGGSVPVEFAIVAPAILGLLMLVMFAARVARTEAQVQAAASVGARAASLEATAGPAEAAAESVAEANLADAEIHCTNIADDPVSLDAANLTHGGTVRVTVTCHVDVSGLVQVGFPGELTFSATSVEVVDRYRGGP